MAPFKAGEVLEDKWEESEQETLRNIPRLLFHSSICQFLPTMVACCLMRLLENKSGREVGGGAKNYVIRHWLWQILEERMEKSLENKNKMFFKESWVSVCVCQRARFWPLFWHQNMNSCSCLQNTQIGRSKQDNFLPNDRRTYFD